LYEKGGVCIYLHKSLKFVNIKSKLDALLRTYNLTSIVNIPSRVQGNSATAIDNIFIDITRRDDYSIRPIINGLSNHDAQSITFNTINMKSYAKQFKIIRKINKYTIDDFLIKLSYEIWDLTFF
jgi:hypothetical protein